MRSSAIPYVRASYPESDDVDPAAEAPATERALVALNGFQAELAQLRKLWLEPELAFRPRIGKLQNRKPSFRFCTRSPVVWLRGFRQTTPW